MFRHLSPILLAALLALGGWLPGALAQASEGYHRLALYIAENDVDRMNGVLDIAANVSRHYSGIGEEVEIEIVAYNQGLHMLREDSSPVKERLSNFMLSMVNVTFQACGNTLDTMERNEGSRPPLLEGTGMVQTGVAYLIELDEAGWTLVRP
jgi:intracellular sulfur oxidation DsrE/DsrF family protein